MTYSVLWTVYPYKSCLLGILFQFPPIAHVPPLPKADPQTKHLPQRLTQTATKTKNMQGDLPPACVVQTHYSVNYCRYVVCLQDHMLMVRVGCYAIKPINAHLTSPHLV